MNQFSALCKVVFVKAIDDYHLKDDVDAPVINPFEEQDISYYLYLKNRIDAAQWHLEDKIRDTDLQPEAAIAIKRKIDRLNQERTDLVEVIDNYFFDQYKDVRIRPDATVNTESPAWAVDRLSILILKIYHWEQEALRKDTDAKHRQTCKEKLQVLYEQQEDLSQALDRLLDDFKTGKKIMKLYKQMKMYNDPSFNPVLYRKKDG